MKCSILCSASTKFTPFTASPRFSAQFRDAGTRERMGIHDRLQSLARKEFLRRRPALPRSHHGNGAAAAAFGAEGNGARFAKMKHGFESSLGRGKSTTGSPFPPVGALASVACRGQAPRVSRYTLVKELHIRPPVHVRTLILRFTAVSEIGMSGDICFCVHLSHSAPTRYAGGII